MKEDKRSIEQLLELRSRNPKYSDKDCLRMDAALRAYNDNVTKQMLDRLKRGSFSRATPTSKGSEPITHFHSKEDISKFMGLMTVNGWCQLVEPGIVQQTNACAEVALDIETDFQNFWAKQNIISPVPSTTPKKENTMSIIDAKILVNLAQADAQDEFTENMATMPVALREAIEEQRRQESKEAMQKAAKLIIQIYKDADVAIRGDVQAIRNARLMEQQAKERIANIQRAKAYAEATNNYLPLASLLGGLQVGSNVDQSKLVIPEDWVAPEEKAEAPVASKKTAAKK